MIQNLQLNTVLGNMEDKRCTKLDLLSVGNMRKLCKDHGLPSNGKKLELKERLEMYYKENDIELKVCSIFIP